MDAVDEGAAAVEGNEGGLIWHSVDGGRLLTVEDDEGTPPPFFWGSATALRIGDPETRVFGVGEEGGGGLFDLAWDDGQEEDEGYDED
ncbi:hypothetical protein L1987_37354 [Smallanthus sonchifolius]|uniref:Uncharacterized protein n=1 Tax=Smallanthus sonchifolius TaxID=185202 RepID=A0ACB9HG53_9ASTR|nr:hypothetical protein L1987_37354 [Smallanthus sonchifolius]